MTFASHRASLLNEIMVIYTYDVIGAVGIKTDRRGKKTVLYHLKWKGYGINRMAWEPESRIFEEDLRDLWSKYGRVGITQKIGRQPLRTS